MIKIIWESRQEDPYIINDIPNTEIQEKSNENEPLSNNDGKNALKPHNKH